MPRIPLLHQVRRVAVSGVVAIGLVVPFLSIGGFTALTASASSGPRGASSGLLSQVLHTSSTQAMAAPDKNGLDKDCDPDGSGDPRPYAADQGGADNDHCRRTTTSCSDRGWHDDGQGGDDHDKRCRSKTITTTVPKTTLVTTTVPVGTVYTTTVPALSVLTTTVPELSVLTTTVPELSVLTTTVPEISDNSTTLETFNTFTQTQTTEIPITELSVSRTLSIYTGTTSFEDAVTTIFEPIIVLTTLNHTLTVTQTSASQYTTTVTSTIDIPTVVTSTIEVPTAETSTIEVPTAETSTIEVPTAETSTIEVPTAVTSTIEVPTVETLTIEVPTTVAR